MALVKRVVGELGRPEHRCDGLRTRRIARTSRRMMEKLAPLPAVAGSTPYPHT